MGISLNVDVNSENEFNQQLQMYLAQGYNMQSNINGTAILKKKSYSVGLLIVLIIFFFPAAIIYYLVASEDMVTIRQNGAGQTSAGSSTNVKFSAYCEDCGHGLLEDSKFCPGCGKDLSEMQDEKVPTCSNCGKEILFDSKFCPNCGQDLSKVENEEPVEQVALIGNEETVEENNVCGNCGTEITDDGKFCPECGEEIKEWKIMPFCRNCGNEVKENTKFCSKCGTAIDGEIKSESPQKNTSGINCPKCGSVVPFGNTVCSNWGNPLNQESHVAAIIIGYLGTIFGAWIFPIIGLIIGIISAIYLLTRPSKSAKIHGVIIIIIVVIIAVLWISYLSYLNSLRSSYYYYY